MVLPELEGSDADVPGEGHEYEDILTLEIEMKATKIWLYLWNTGCGRDVRCSTLTLRKRTMIPRFLYWVIRVTFQARRVSGFRSECWSPKICWQRQILTVGR